MVVRAAHLDPERKAWDERLLAARARRAKLLYKCLHDRQFRAKVWHVCRRNPVFWFDNFVWVYDPRFPPYMLPWQSYGKQPDIIRLITGKGPGARDEYGELWPLIVEKSRDEGWSWVAMGGATWGWLFESGSDYGVMTRVGADLDDKSPNSLFGKIDWILDHLPRWMRPERDVEMTRTGRPPVLRNLLNGNVIKGATTTEGSLRGPRLRRVFVDEAAHVKPMKKLLTALSSTTGALALGSSVEGMGNAFAQIAHSRGDYRCQDWGTEEEVAAGVWRKVRLHWTDNPRKGKAWEMRTRARMTDQTFAQEQDIDYQVSVPNRIYPEWSDDLVYSADSWDDFKPYLRGARIIESWDFGSGKSLTAVVWAAYLPKHDRLILLDYCSWSETHYKAVAVDVGARGWATKANPNGRKPHLRIGDNAGTARGSAQDSWLTNLDSEGIEIEGRLTRDVEYVISQIRVKMREGHIFAAPAIKERYNRDLPTLHESLSQYQRRVRRGKEYGDTAEPDKDSVHSHPCDCVWYLGAELWCQNEVRTIPQYRREREAPQARQPYQHY